MKVCLLSSACVITKPLFFTQVYLPALEGHIPSEMMRAVQAFMDFCYIVRREFHDTNTLRDLQEALDRYSHYRTIFQTCGVRPTGFNLPRQHSRLHYFKLIRAFGAPNGLCSSITESKHIAAIKEPWRRSSRYQALGQMLLTNQRLDKLAASRADFKARGMLTASLNLFSEYFSLDSRASTNRLSTDQGTDVAPPAPAAPPPTASGDDNDDEAAAAGPRIQACVNLAKTVTRMHLLLIHLLPSNNGYMIGRNMDASDVAADIGQPDLIPLIRHFLYDQLHPHSDSSTATSSLPLPFFDEPISVYPSAVATFYSPSDLCGTQGMRHERIRAVPSWRRGPGRYDCVFVNTDSDAEGMRGLDVGRVRLFFSFRFRGKFYPCALVHWYSRIGDNPDGDTGMWRVRQDHNAEGSPSAAILHLDCLVRAAHLIGVYGKHFIPKGLLPEQSLDLFRSYYVNKFIDHHSYEIAF